MKEGGEWSALKTTESFAEKVKTAPEYATADGLVEINVLVLQGAKRRL